MKKLTGLQELGLGDTSVSDAGIAQIEGLSHLAVLGLEQTKVTDTGVHELQKTLPKMRYAVGSSIPPSPKTTDFGTPPQSNQFPLKSP